MLIKAFHEANNPTAGVEKSWNRIKAPVKIRSNQGYTEPFITLDGEDDYYKENENTIRTDGVGLIDCNEDI